MSGGSAVSVVVPVFNGMPYLPATLDSAARQTLQDLELIVVDNHSTDGTAAFLETWIARSHPFPVRVVRPPTFLSMVDNWMWAIDQSTAPLVKLLMADDLLSPECLQRQVAALHDHPSCSLASCARRVVSARGVPRFVRNPLGRTALIPSNVIRSKIFRHVGNLIGEPSAIVFRRSAWAACCKDKVRSFRYLLDLAMWLELSREGDVWHDAKPLVDFRIHGGASSTSLQSLEVEESLRLIEWMDESSLPCKEAFVRRARRRVRRGILLRGLVYRFLS